MDLTGTRSRLADLDSAVLGARIKAVRIASGLTQGEVADGLLSISYLSRIESGKRRPDAERLVSLAGRLGVDHEQFLSGTDVADVAVQDVSSGSPVLDFAEIAVDMGDPETALGQLTETELTGLVGRDLDRADLVRAKALEATGDLNSAIEVLERLLTRTHDDLARVPLVMMLSRCHRELGELDDATRVGEDALRRVADVDLDACVEVVQLRVTVAAAYVEKGELDHALRLCRQALASAETLDSPTARASAYWETSVISMKQGDAETGVRMARRALALMGEGTDDRILTRLRVQVGMMELDLDAPDVATARARFDAAAEQMRLNHATSTERLEVELGLARCDLLDGDPDTAWSEGQRLLDTARGISPVSEADVLTLLGRAAAARGDVDGVRECLLAAVHRLHAVDSPREAGQRWVELAAMLERVGELEAALGAYRAAVASSGLRPPKQPLPDLAAAVTPGASRPVQA